MANVNFLSAAEVPMSIPDTFALLMISDSFFGKMTKLWETSPRKFILLALLALLAIILLISLLMRSIELPSILRARHNKVLDPIQVEELMIGTPPQIIDLRTNETYRGEKGHIRGTINIPFEELFRRVGELEHDQKRPIVLVDESDALSHQAARGLAEKGYSWVYVLKGGMRAWRRSNLPIYYPQSSRVN